MKNILLTKLSGPKILLLFCITTSIYLIMILFTIPIVMNQSEGMELFDMMPLGYNIEYANLLLSNLAQPGREDYLHKQLPMDALYPAFFGISYFYIFIYFTAKINKRKSVLPYFSLLAPLAGIFDYAENIGIITLILSYPNITINQVTITSAFSILKSSCTTLYYFALLYILFILGLNTIQSKFKNEKIFKKL